MMTKEETWKRLVDLGVVKGKMPEGKWDLAGAYLTTANLVWADFRGARLDEAKLNGADLYGANLFEASLNRAYLFETNLCGADLSRATLIGADLGRAKLMGASLIGANLSGALLSEATIGRADLRDVDLSRAKLNGASLGGPNLNWANLSEASLIGANLAGADLYMANFSGADLTGADLRNALLVKVNFEKAKLNNCQIYGVSAWDLQLQGAEQANLVIEEFFSPMEHPSITVDNLKVAQFIHLLLNNPEVRDVLDSITSKVVLILGRFTPERKAVLDAIRNELRQRNYIPVLFDFEGPENRNITETVSTLAHMARFVIADITDAKSIPQELTTIVPHLPSVPVQPLLQGSSEEYGMFRDFKSYPWVLPIYRYKDIHEVVASLPEKIISPAEAKIKQQRQKDLP
jgi:uncharacterized protein YjbI with pentapeptide repeats